MNLAKLERVDCYKTTDGKIFEDYSEAKEHQRKIQSSFWCRLGFHSWPEWEFVRNWSNTGNPFTGFGNTEVERGYTSKRECLRCGKKATKVVTTWTLIGGSTGN